MNKLDRIDGVTINTNIFSGAHGGIHQKVFGQYKRALEKQKNKNDIWKRFREKHPVNQND